MLSGCSLLPNGIQPAFRAEENGAVGDGQGCQGALAFQLVFCDHLELAFGLDDRAQAAFIEEVNFAVCQDGRSAETEKAIAKTEMVDSQIAAKSAALNYLGQNFPNGLASNFKPSDIEISLAKTGGPSGGLAFAIGIVELLTSENILQGRSVATTGTIDSNGNVGSIGGVAEKILAAKKAGATLFLVPQGNCKDLAPDRKSVV